MADTPYWLSALAEECAMLADNRDAAGLSALLKQHAKYHGLSEAALTALVAKEWDRVGIARPPLSGFLRGWID